MTILGNHQCPAPGCFSVVGSHLLACRRHWHALPKEIRYRIWRHYVPAQTIKTALPGYLEALHDAMDYWVAHA